MSEAIASKRYAAVAAACLGLSTVLLLLFAGGPVYTDDLWWHLKLGETFAAVGPWIAQDPMLHTASVKTAAQHEWLFSTFVFYWSEWTGFFGLRALHAISVGLIVWLVYTVLFRASHSRVLAALFVCVFIVLATDRLVQLRPDLFSIAACLLGYRLVLENGRVPENRDIALYLILILLWANVHSLFLISLNLIIAALLGSAIGVWILQRFVTATPTPSDPPWQTEKRLGLTLVLGLLVSAINPRGFGQHLLFFKSSEDSALWRITDEWSHFYPLRYGLNDRAVSPLEWWLTDAVLALFLVSACFWLVGVMREPVEEGERRAEFVGFGLAAAAIVALLASIRFTWMLIFPLLFISRVWAPYCVRAGFARIGVWVMVGLQLMLLSGMVREQRTINFVTRFADAPGEYLRLPYRTHKFFAEGVHFLQQAGIEGKLFNSYWTGGFLGYWLAPRLRTFVDGRVVDYGADVYLDFSNVTRMQGTQPGETFLDVLDRRDVNVFFGVGYPGWWHDYYTTAHLEGASQWVLVSRSYRHAIYLRKGTANKRNFENVAAYYARQGIDFDPNRGLDVDWVMREHLQWGMQHAMWPGNYTELLADFQGNDTHRRLYAGSVLAFTLAFNGAYRSQVEIDRVLAAEYPAEKTPRARLVYGLLQLGRGEEAKQEMARLLMLGQGDENLQKLERLVTRYLELEESDATNRDPNAWIPLKRLLLAELPVSQADAWTLEYAMRTEGYPLSHAKPE